MATVWLMVTPSTRPGDDSADGTDQDCDGLDSPYVADFMVDLIEGDLILTEFLADPVAVSDGDGRWIEFQVNPTLTGSLDSRA